MYPVSLFASIFPYSKQKSTYTCCLCAVRSVPKEKTCQYKQLFSCSARTFTAIILSPQQFSCQCAPSLTGSEKLASPIGRVSQNNTDYHCLGRSVRRQYGAYVMTSGHEV